jgi:hypothetical protein
MRAMTIGCTAALVGLIIGAALVLGAVAVFAQQGTPLPSGGVVVPGQADVSISFSANYLNSQLQQVIKQTGLVKQATLTLAPPNIAQVVTTVNANILGQTVSTSVSIRMHATVVNGRVVLTVDNVDAGALGLAQGLVAPTVEQLRAQAETQINQMIQRNLQGTGLKPSNIRATTNDISLDLTAQ